MHIPMESVLRLMARLLLAGIFFAASAAKLKDRHRFQNTLLAFGSPTEAAPPLAIAVPCAELLIGAALLMDPVASWAAVAALCLLALFTATIAINLRRGRRPACQCFGEISSEAIGAGTILRNVAFAALALFAALPGPSASLLDLAHLDPTLSAGATGAAGVALAILVGQTWLIGLLLSQERNLAERVAALEAQVVPRSKGLRPGTPAPAFTAPNVRGGTVTLAELLEPGQPVLLYFFDPDCGPCKLVLPHIARAQAELEGRLRFVLIGRRMMGRPLTPEYEPFLLLAQEDRETSDHFEVPGIPAAQIVDRKGRIQSVLAVGQDAIVHLLANATR